MARDRRTFLKAGAALAGAAALTHNAPGAAAPDNDYLPPNIPPWTRSTGAGVAAHPYGLPSRFEADVIRRTLPWLTASPLASVSFTPLYALHGIMTPSGALFERHHAGAPEIDPADHRLMIHGLVERPLILTVAELQRFPRVSAPYFLECAANGALDWRAAQTQALQFSHGMLGCCEWTGVPLKILLEEAGVKPQAQWLLAEGADGAAMTRSIPLEKALDDALVAYGQNGEALRPEHGYPLRLVAPGWEGNTWVKWLRRLELGDRPWHTREETAKYTDLMPDGHARQFSLVQEANSVITSPCPEKSLHTKGFHEIQGLAWSGRGRIARVDVALDGGNNWQPARLNGLVLPKALTRFSLDWRWNGEPTLLQSRAIDETGYVQPTLAALRRARGVNSVYHRNAIHTWHIAADGAVSHVQID